MTRFDFVEHKTIDFDGVTSYLKTSEDEGRMANYGPNVQRLEGELLDLYGLLRGKRIGANFSCAISSNGSIAIDAAIACHCLNIDKSLTEITCLTGANGFHCLRQGKFAHQTYVIDCDESGLISKNLVANWIDKNKSVDVIIYTNYFGLGVANLPELLNFCIENQIALIVDNAASLASGEIHASYESVYETFSMHHTKPWGFGEGGGIISNNKNVDLIRTLLNFGVSENFGTLYRRYGVSNGKMSEVSAAYQRMWLLRFTDTIQTRLALIDEYWQIFGAYSPVELAFAKPVVASFAISLSRRNTVRELANILGDLPFGKYYLPLKSFYNVDRFYDHVVNIPISITALEHCHEYLSIFEKEGLLINGDC